MNYLLQIRAFDDYRLYETKLSSGQVSLWYTLMSINNKAHWQEWFTAANIVLERLSGLSRQGIVKNRNVLKQLGLIDFQSNGRKATSYHVSKLYTSNSVQVSLQDSVQNSVQDSVQDSVQNSSTLIKHKQNKTKSSRRKRVYDQDDDFMKLAIYLFKFIKENNQDARKPNWQEWADDMRKIVEIDKRSKHDVALVIKWCQQDAFWSTNILSPSKLRKQFDQLKVKMSLGNGSTTEPRVSKQEEAKKKANKERSKFVLYKYSEAGNDLEKALPIIKDKYPEIDTPDKALRILFPERYLTAGGVEVGN